MKKKYFLFCLLVVFIIGCGQAHDNEDEQNNNGGVNEMEERIFDWENSVRVAQEALYDVDPEIVERRIVHTVIIGARVNGIIRMEEFEPEPFGIRAFEIESEDNQVFYLYLSGNHVDSVIVPETGMPIYEVIE